MIGFDTETGLIAPGLLVPPLVCLTLAGAGSTPPAWASPPGCIVRSFGDAWGTLLDARMAVDAFLRMLEGPCIGHNAPYDLAELAEAHRLATSTADAITAVFEALLAGRVRDTQVRELLLRIASDELKFTIGPDGVEKSSFSLADLVRRYLGVDISESKTDPNAWRLRYRELADVPLSRWPTEAVDYAMLDAYWPLRVADAQCQTPRVIDGFEVHDGDLAVHTEAREVGAAFALHLMATWGMRTEPSAVDATLRAWNDLAEQGADVGRRLGFVRVKGRDKGKPGSVDQKKLMALVSAAYNGNPPMTDPSTKFPAGQIRVAEEVLRDSGNADLREYSLSMTAKGYMSRNADILRAGVAVPITSRPNVLVASGRTSWAKPALHQPPREGGFRGCFVPRRGWLYASADYDFIELCAVSQVCYWQFGSSTLGDTINAGRDPHLVMACQILNAYDHPERPASYDEAKSRKKEPLIVEHRQLAKAANFGLWGGLGAETFVEYARATYDIQTLTVEKAGELRDIWKDTNPEAREYFRWVTESLELQDTVQQFVSGRVRGGVRFTSACNTFFQGLAADGAKYSMFLAAKAAYAAPSSPMYGSRPVLLLHDEIIMETPEEGAAEAAEELARVMITGMKEHIPDVRIGAKPVLTRRWTKGADPTYTADGRLTVTESK